MSEKRKEGFIRRGRIAEQISVATTIKNDIADVNLISKYTGLTIEEILKESEIEKEIKELNINEITPMDAINLISKWKKYL